MKNGPFMFCSFPLTSRFCFPFSFIGVSTREMGSDTSFNSDQRNHRAMGVVYTGLMVSSSREPLVRIETTGAKSSVILLLLPYSTFRWLARHLQRRHQDLFWPTEGG